MERLVKYIDQHTIEEAPRVIFDGDRYIANPSEDTLKGFGYKPIVVDPEPEITEGQTLLPRYQNTSTKVKQHWDIVEGGGDE